MKKRSGTPWKPAGEYSKELGGLTVNLLVRDMPKAIAFAREVLQANIVYEDPDFAALEAQGSKWCLHADHTYNDHPLSGSLAETEVRGVGAELRVMGLDPDGAEARARAAGYTVLAGALDKAHGMREAYILDADGYLWVPSVTPR
jgi:catechol 2,3-dioxygenase-like lactoylglutathione lyase family enzyme